MRLEMVRLAQKVRKGKSEIKGWISEMNHFVIDEDQFVFVDQNIFGTEIAVHKAKAPAASHRDQRIQEIRCGRLLGSAVRIVRLEA